jgi:hypothetical protein
MPHCAPLQKPSPSFSYQAFSMSRYEFTPGKEYAAKLCNVTERPVENKNLALVRLEFEIYTFLEERNLDSTGKIACRDIIVGTGANIKGDASVWPFIEALAVRSPDTVNGWLALSLRKPKPWVKIIFGSVDKSDERNPFVSICRFDTAGFAITEYNYDLVEDWVTVSAAARALRKSMSTVRRMIKSYEGEFGRRLVRRTKGNHRRINIRLLRNLGSS